jgi:hypothetical protein
MANEYEREHERWAFSAAFWIEMKKNVDVVACELAPACISSWRPPASSISGTMVYYVYYRSS